MEKSASERVIVSAPMSFTGSTERIWRITEKDYDKWLYWLLVVPATALLLVAVWSIILCWYLLFGILLIPYRLLRRSQRKSRKEELRHRELLAAVDAKKV